MRTLQVVLAPCGTILAVLGFAVLPSGLLLVWAVFALTVGGLAAHIARDAHATPNPGGRFADAITHRSPRRIAGVTAVLTYLTVPVLAGTAALLGAAAPRSWCFCANVCSTSWSAATARGSGGG